MTHPVEIPKASGGRAHHRRLAHFAATLLAAALLVCALAGAAEAAEHPYEPALSQSGIPEACGAAVDSQGDLYVASFSGEVVHVFTPAGSPITEIHTAGHNAGPPCSLAVDPAGDVYVNGLNMDVVKYSPSAYPPVVGATTYTSSAPLATGPITSVAVDPATGNVYTAEAEAINEYGPTGTLINGPIKFGSPNYYGIDVHGADGDIYVTNLNTKSVEILNPTGTAVLTSIDGKANPNNPGGFANLGTALLAVDQSDGDVYVGTLTESNAISQFTATGAFVSQIGEEFGPSLTFVNSEPSDLAVDNGASSPHAGTLYVDSGENVYAFGPVSAGGEVPLTITTAGNGSGTVECDSGSGPEACAAEYPEGTHVTITGTPAAGSEFTGFSGACTGTTCEVTLSSARSVTVGFAPKPAEYPLSVTTAGGGLGSVACDTGSGPGPCAEKYAEGTHVTITATAAAGSEFTGFSGACTGGRCEVTLVAPRSATASFETSPGAMRSLVVAKTGSGSGVITSSPSGVSCGSTCAFEYALGTKVTLTASAAPGSEFVGYSGGGCSGTGACTVTVTRATTVSAQFRALPQASTGPTAGSFKVRSAVVSGGQARLHLQVPGSGRIKVSGRYLKTTSVRAKHGGSATVTVSLTVAGQKRLASRGKLTVKAAVTFLPSAGSPLHASQAIVFKSKGTP